MRAKLIVWDRASFHKARASPRTIPHPARPPPDNAAIMRGLLAVDGAIDPRDAGSERNAPNRRRFPGEKGQADRGFKTQPARRIPMVTTLRVAPPGRRVEGSSCARP